MAWRNGHGNLEFLHGNMNFVLLATLILVLHFFNVRFLSIEFFSPRVISYARNFKFSLFHNFTINLDLKRKERNFLQILLHILKNNYNIPYYVISSLNSIPMSAIFYFCWINCTSILKLVFRLSQQNIYPQSFEVWARS